MPSKMISSEKIRNENECIKRAFSHSYRELCQKYEILNIVFVQSFSSQTTDPINKVLFGSETRDERKANSLHMSQKDSKGEEMNKFEGNINFIVFEFPDVISLILKSSETIPKSMCLWLSSNSSFIIRESFLSESILSLKIRVLFGRKKWILNINIT